uniref:Secreted protein n=1 Tax=Physcomitrium patens TaxID=3218 RepID=A0A2K1KFE6_PHYPA|nr:hypothetical protein PHYPA_008869 [Physcomitrium patens]
MPLPMLSLWLLLLELTFVVVLPTKEDVEVAWVFVVATCDNLDNTSASPEPSFVDINWARASTDTIENLRQDWALSKIF